MRCPFFLPVLLILFFTSLKFTDTQDIIALKNKCYKKPVNKKVPPASRTVLKAL